MLAPILLRPQCLSFLLLQAPNGRLLQQVQLYLCGGGLRRNTQQNDKQQAFDHGTPVRSNHALALTVALRGGVIKMP